MDENETPLDNAESVPEVVVEAAPEVVVEAPVVEGNDVGKCPTCGRDKGQDMIEDPPEGKCECGRDLCSER